MEVVTYLAQTLGERVILGTVANALGPPVFPSNRVLDGKPGYAANASERAHAAAQQLRDHGIEVTEVVLGGDPANALISEATRLSAQTIIIGQHDAEQAVPPLCNSMIEILTHESPCPVRIVPRSGDSDHTEVMHDQRVNASTSGPLAPLKAHALTQKGRDHCGLPEPV